MPVARQVTIPNRAADIRGVNALADADTARLVTRVPLGRLPVPSSVVLRADDLLVFEWTAGVDLYDPLEAVRARAVPDNLLERFVSLPATPAAVVTFAQQFGALALFPSRYGLRPDPARLTMAEPHAEPLAGWVRFRREFDSLLTLAAVVQGVADLGRDTLTALAENGVDLPMRTLADLVWSGDEAIERWMRLRADDQKRRVAELLIGRVGTLARWCDLRPTLTVAPGTRIDLHFTDSNPIGLSLFGALTVQLFAAVTGRGFAVCSACGRVFVPKPRQPVQGGRRRFCAGCGRPEALKAAKAVYRAKLRSLGVPTLGPRRRTTG